MSEHDKPQEAAKIEKTVKKIEELLEELVEEIDLEQHSKTGKKPPKAKRYRIRIDDRYFVVTQHSMTGREILLLAGKTPPENFILTEKSKGGALHTVELDEVEHFTKHGIERFNTLPRQVQEG
jgi:predicted ribosome quality control (RQC) complex YloA/Tae2 family protein